MEVGEKEKVGRKSESQLIVQVRQNLALTWVSARFGSLSKFTSSQ